MKKEVTKGEAKLLEKMTCEGEEIAKRYPEEFDRAVRLAYAEQVAHTDFRKTLREWRINSNAPKG